MAADPFVEPTVTFRLLFVLVILGHHRRRIVHVAVTEHLTAAWTAQQLRNAFSEHDAPRYLLHDRDSVFADVATTISGMNMQTVLTAARSPWQNAYAERVIGSIRRECLDHVIVVNGAGLRRAVTAYITYYMQSRPRWTVETGNLWTAQNRQFRRTAETSEFYFFSSSGRKSVCSFVRQLRGPHFSTCA